MNENLVENRLKKRAKAKGWWALKWVSPGTTGVPDRILLTSQGRLYFIELKAPSGRLSKRQKWVHKQMKHHGFEVYVLNNIQKVDEFIEGLSDDEVL